MKVLCTLSDTLPYRLRHGLSLCLIGLLLASSAIGTDDDPVARALILKREEMLRSQTNVGRYRMQIVRPTWKRTLTFMSWDEVASKRTFMHILGPPKDKDTTFLKVGDNLWTYLPKLERDIKLPPSMMLGSWMGSDFTNDDLVKASSVVDDYTHRTLQRQGVGVDEVFIIESRPKPDAAVVWGKLVHHVTSEGLALETEFYDEHGKPLRHLRYENVRTFDGRRLPTRWVVQPLAKPGHHTVLDIELVEFDAPIPDSVFKRANLSRRRR